MNTFLQVLRLAFWINPLQRVLTCMTALLIVVDAIGTLWTYFHEDLFDFRLSQPATVFERLLFRTSALQPKWEMIFVTANCLLMAGVYWRVASAPRIVRLAPHGRTRLLGSVVAVVLMVALLSIGTYSLLLSARLQGFGIIIACMIPCAQVASVAVVGLFVASRSPLAALLVLIVLLFPVSADLMTARQAVLSLPVFVWIPFAIWYLRARRISPPGWLANGSHDVLATALVSAAPPKSRNEALQRQLLGGTTTLRFGLQWFVILGLLLGMQWLIAGISDTDAALSAAVMYGSLCICPVVTTIVSFAAIRRSRALWLLTSSTRGEFFLCVEGILRRLNLVMGLVFAIWLAVLWFMQSWRPGDVQEQVALAQFHLMGLWWLGWFAFNSQLAGMPKWPMAIVAAGLLIIMWGLSTMPITTHRGEAFAGLAVTILLIGAAIASVALRWFAQRRWREGDFPRAVTSAASGT